jgi:hypothetical protein
MFTVRWTRSALNELVALWMQMAMREIYSSREVLECAIVDGINRYLRDVLEPLGIIQKALDDSAGSSLNDMKHRIAEEVASAWEHCQMEDGC